MLTLASPSLQYTTPWWVFDNLPIVWELIEASLQWATAPTALGSFAVTRRRIVDVEMCWWRAVDFLGKSLLTTYSLELFRRDRIAWDDGSYDDPLRSHPWKLLTAIESNSRVSCCHLDFYLHLNVDVAASWIVNWLQSEGREKIGKDVRALSYVNIYTCWRRGSKYV